MIHDWIQLNLFKLCDQVFEDVKAEQMLKNNATF